MALVLRPLDGKIPLTTRLARIGRDRRQAAVLGGAFRGTALLLLALTAEATLDVAIHLPATARAVLLVVAVTGVVATHRRFVAAPLREGARPADVARLLETRYPKLNDALASAVDFLTTSRSGAAQFRDIAVVRAENLTGRFDLAAIVPSRSAWTGFWLCAAAVALASGLTITHPTRAGLAVVRLVDPFGRHPFPTATVVELKSPLGENLRLARGEPFAVQFAVRGVRPGLAVIETKAAGSDATGEPVPLPARADGEPAGAEVVVDAKLDAGRVSHDFSFRVVAHDGETAWHPVTVAPAPKLVPLDGRPSPQVRLVFPTYTDLKPTELPDGAGVVEAVAGTVIEFRAATDLPIARAWFAPQFDRVAQHTALACAPLAAANPFGLIAAQLLADAIVDDIPVQVTGSERTRLEAMFTPHQPGLYLLSFTDDTGLTGTRLFDFRLTPDAPPTVTLGRPTAGSDPLALLPIASLTVEAHTDDRPFAVRAVALEYRNGAEWQSLPLADWEAARDRLPALAGGATIMATKPPAVDVSRVVAVASFRRPDGSRAADGDIVTVRAAAWDFDTRTTLKEPGRSKEVELRILGTPSLEAQFQKELAALRPELLRLQEELRDAAAKTAELRDVAKTRPLTPDELARLAQVEQAQRQARAKLDDPADGVRPRVERLRRTARANALPRSATTDKVAKVLNELNRLADQDLSAADPALSAAKQTAEAGGGPRLAEQLAAAAQHQQAARQSVARLLETLEQWGGAGEIRGGARALAEQVNRTPTPGPTQTERAGAADKLNQAADQAADLLAKATRLASQKEAQAEVARAAAGQQQAAAQAHAEAEALRKGVEAAGGDALPADLRLAAAETRAGRQGTAASARQAALNKLDKLANPLAEPDGPAATAGGDTAARAAASAEVEQLAEEQALLRKKAKKAAAEPDPAKQAAALQALAAEQDALREKAEQLAERLKRTPPAAADGADPAVETLRRTAAAQEAARGQLEQGQPPAGKQEEALDQLDETLKKLDQEKGAGQEQLDREERDKLADLIKSLRDKQKAAVAEADRVQAALLEAKQWDRPLVAALRDLREREEQFAIDSRRFAIDKLLPLPVFGKLVDQAADAADAAVKRLAERTDDARDADAADIDPAGEAAAHKRVRAPMARALAKLDMILAALDDKPKKPQKPPMPTGDPAGGEPGAGGEAPPPHGGGVPALAQLKALRVMQAEVNEATAAFHEVHPDPAKLTAGAKAELKELERAQRDVAVLFEKLAATIAPPPEEP